MAEHSGTETHFSDPESFHGINVSVEAPMLERLVVSTCTGSFNYSVMQHLSFMSIKGENFNGFKARTLPDRLKELSMETKGLGNVRYIALKIGIIDVLTVGLDSMNIGVTKGEEVEFLSKVLRNVVHLNVRKAYKLFGRKSAPSEPGFDMLRVLTLDFRPKQAPDVSVAKGFVERALKLSRIEVLVDVDVNSIRGLSDLDLPVTVVKRPYI